MNESTVGAAVTKKKSGKAANTVINIILILAILLGIFCSFTAFVAKSGNGVPSFFGIRPFAIQTDSMKPFFNRGDLIIDTVVDPRTLEVGDVITFWTVIEGERTLNSHRIIAIDDYENYVSFTTKGDANSMEDALTVHQSEVVGKYAGKVPKLGTMISFLETGTGFFLVIVLPCAALFIYELIEFFKALFAYKTEKMRIMLQNEMGNKPKEDSVEQEKIVR